MLFLLCLINFRCHFFLVSMRPAVTSVFLHARRFDLAAVAVTTSGTRSSRTYR